MNNYIINYNEKIYSNLDFYFLGNKYKTINLKNADLPFCIDKIFNIYEDNNIISFSISNIIFDIISEKEIFSQQDDIFVIQFDKKTLRATGNKFDNDLLLILNDSRYRNFILDFISRIINLNENIKNHFLLAPSYVVNINNAVYIKNLFNLIVFNLPEYEKLINSNNISFLKENLDKESFEISEANKLHQVVGLPKFVINFLKDNKLEELTDNFKKLSEVIDGNSLNIILEFLENGKMIFENQFSGKLKNLRKEKLALFINNLTNILSRKNYKVTDLLNYLIKQSFYYSNCGYFVFPCDEAMYLSDYLDMCDKYKLSVEKYPSQLKIVHNIISLNIVSLEDTSDITKEKFKEAVDSYKKVEKEISITYKNDDGSISEKSFVFVVPKDLKDIVNEGNVQHHCVGSYGDKVIRLEARIVFMREKEAVNIPYVTINIDKNMNLIEAKQAFNEDVTEIQYKAIQKWLKEIH